MSSTPKPKTWIEINSAAVKHNYKIIKSLLRPKTKLFSVVKSNAYGHGLLSFSEIADKAGADGFCVDSVIEGLKLRQNRIKKPILVLGPTFPHLFEIAENNGILITISGWDLLRAWIKAKNKPDFHLKIDTGMHRQGFYAEDLPKIIKLLKTYKLNNLLTGVYTHFASAKDINYPAYTELQFEKFKKAIKILSAAGFSSSTGGRSSSGGEGGSLPTGQAGASGGKNILCHAAATGGTLLNQKYHLDAVRIGIGLYGLWPSKELEIQMPDIHFSPVLSWHALISEIKDVKKGSFIGYDLIERIVRPTKVAVIPIGYWHGFDRGLSSIGEVLINGKRARVLGRVSMDIIIVDATGIQCKVGDKTTLIGKQKNDEISALEPAQKLGTTYYEVLTRINPLIERIIT